MRIEDILKELQNEHNPWDEYRQLISEYLQLKGVDVKEFWKVEMSIKKKLGLIKSNSENDQA